MIIESTNKDDTKEGNPYLQGLAWIDNMIQVTTNIVCDSLDLPRLDKLYLGFMDCTYFDQEKTTRFFYWGDHLKIYHQKGDINLNWATQQPFGRNLTKHSVVSMNYKNTTGPQKKYFIADNGKKAPMDCEARKTFSKALATALEYDGFDENADYWTPNPDKTYIFVEKRPVGADSLFYAYDYK